MSVSSFRCQLKEPSQAKPLKRKRITEGTKLALTLLVLFGVYRQHTWFELYAANIRATPFARRSKSKRAKSQLAGPARAWDTVNESNNWPSNSNDAVQPSHLLNITRRNQTLTLYQFWILIVNVPGSLSPQSPFWGQARKINGLLQTIDDQ